MEYRQISTHTMDGLNQAEKLKAEGWELYRSGLFMCYFRRLKQRDRT